MGSRTTALDFGWRFHLGDVLPDENRTGSCVYEVGRNYGEGNIAALTLATPEDCCAACSDNLECIAWDFDTATTATNCWLKDNGESYKNATDRVSGTLPPAGPSPAIAVDYNDSDWPIVSLPHDYPIAGNFTADADGKDTCYLDKPVAWYRLHFDLPAEVAAGDVAAWIEFEGVYRSAEVYLNGDLAAERESGYTSFVIPLGGDDAPPVVEGENVLAVRVDPTSSEGEWWYSGAGINRHVHLYTAAGKSYIVPYGGTWASTAQIGSISDDGTTGSDVVLDLQTPVQNNRSDTADFLLVSAIHDVEKGSVVAAINTTITLKSGEGAMINQTANIDADVKLWHPDHPFLYELRSTLYYSVDSTSTAVSDDRKTRFGVREAVFDADRGMLMNGSPLKIHGFCGHNSLGGLGIGIPRSVNELRVRSYKAIGANGWRMSHNAPTPELLDLLDEYGIVVMDENRQFDDEDSLIAMLLRDRHHPSVVMWSLCNEAGCPLDTGEDAAKDKVNLVRTIDSTRPVTAAMNSGWMEDESMAKGLDIVGFNYGGGDDYDQFHSAYPDQPIFASETSRCMIDRGVYDDSDPMYNTIQSGDDCMMQWVQYNEKRDFMAGIFVWIGFDFYGEPKPNYWPQISAKKGIWDLAGFAKDSFYWYKSWWRNDNDAHVLHLLPHWNWKTGDSVEIYAYTSADSVELELNGKSLGTHNNTQWNHPPTWKVDFSAGTLTARGYDADGKLVAVDNVTTAGEASAVRLSLDYPDAAVDDSDGAGGFLLMADGQDTAAVRATVIDADGNVVPTADNEIIFSLTGTCDAEIIGLHSGDPNTHEASNSGAYRFKAFNGLARAWVRAGRTAKTTITISAEIAGLGDSKASPIEISCA